MANTRMPAWSAMNDVAATVDALKVWHAVDAVQLPKARQGAPALRTSRLRALESAAKAQMSWDLRTAAVRAHCLERAAEGCAGQRVRNHPEQTEVQRGVEEAAEPRGGRLAQQALIGREGLAQVAAKCERVSQVLRPRDRVEDPVQDRVEQVRDLALASVVGAEVRADRLVADDQAVLVDRKPLRAVFEL